MNDDLAQRILGRLTETPFTQMGTEAQDQLIGVMADILRHLVTVPDKLETVALSVKRIGEKLDSADLGAMQTALNALETGNHIVLREVAERSIGNQKRLNDIQTLLKKRNGGLPEERLEKIRARHRRKEIILQAIIALIGIIIGAIISSLLGVEPVNVLSP